MCSTPLVNHGAVTRFDVVCRRWRKHIWQFPIPSLCHVFLWASTGYEVIVPAPFVATANAVLYTGALLRFAEISGEHDLNISPEEIERQITPHTKAVIVVHYGGFPCNMPAIREITDRRGIAIIEDTAHAPGARLQDSSLGTWGDVGCFSFFSNKNISTGEGGMLVTNRDDVAEKVRILRSHGMTSLTWDRHQGHASSYDVVDLGYNYRIDEIRSALGLVQLGKLGVNNELRRVHTQRYHQNLRDSGVGLPFVSHLGQPAFHLLPILLPAVEVNLLGHESAGIKPHSLSPVPFYLFSSKVR
jgi:dTDP-4-amino-4,6-dideoxygalactose transaminase